MVKNANVNLYGTLLLGNFTEFVTKIEAPMRTPKALRLFSLLKKKELVLLEKKLKNDNRKHQLKLLEWLKSDSHLNEYGSLKPNLFEKLFNEPYSKSKNYRLRNELRHLTEYIEELLVELAIKNERQTHRPGFHYFLLTSLQERKALDIFATEYKNVYERSLQNIDFLSAYKIAELNFYNLTHLLHESEANLEEARSINEMQLTNISSFYLSSYRQYQLNNSLINHLQYPFSPGTYPMFDVHYDPLKYENEDAYYLFTKARYYAMPVSERLPQLENCLEFIEKRKKDSDFFKDEYKLCLGEMAILQLFVNGHEKAVPILNKFFDLDLNLDDPYRLNLISHYAMWLLNYGKINEAILLLEKNEKSMQNIEKYQTRFKALSIAAYALAGDAQSLFKNLPTHFGDFSRTTKEYFRIYHSIQFWLSENGEAAVRELNNLLNTISKSGPTLNDVSGIIKLMRRFFKWASMLETKQVRQQLKRLNSDVKKYEESATIFQKNYLPFIWLKKQLGNLGYLK